MFPKGKGTGSTQLKTRHKPTREMVCSACRQRFRITQGALRSAFRPRCPACGGPLNLPREA
jgi:hypothetical protein